jgi:hypothetical protein
MRFRNLLRGGVDEGLDGNKAVSAGHQRVSLFHNGRADLRDARANLDRPPTRQSKSGQQNRAYQSALRVRTMIGLLRVEVEELERVFPGVLDKGLDLVVVRAWIAGGACGWPW